MWIKQNRKSDSLFWGMGHWTRANAEFCMLGGICDKTAYRLLKSGEIKSFIVGRHYRIPKLNILEYLELIDKSNA